MSANDTCRRAARNRPSERNTTEVIAGDQVSEPHLVEVRHDQRLVRCEPAVADQRFRRMELVRKLLTLCGSHA